MDQHDAQTGTDPLQGVRDIGGAVIDDQLDRDTPFEERLLEGRPSMSSAVSPRQKAPWATSLAASSKSDTR
jgi:hypothetical protein